MSPQNKESQTDSHSSPSAHHESTDPISIFFFSDKCVALFPKDIYMTLMAVHEDPSASFLHYAPGRGA